LHLLPLKLAALTHSIELLLLNKALEIPKREANEIDGQEFKHHEGAAALDDVVRVLEL